MKGRAGFEAVAAAAQWVLKSGPAAAVCGSRRRPVGACVGRQGAGVTRLLAPNRPWAVRTVFSRVVGWVLASTLATLPSTPAGAQTSHPGSPEGGRSTLPQRNLLVELRHGDAAGFEDADPFTVRSAHAQGSTVQQLWVLNGQHGLLRTGLTVPVQWYQAGWSPDGPVLIEGRGAVDTGRSVGVRVRWPGGQAPVTVELRSEASAWAGGGMRSRVGPDGQPLPEGAVDSAGLLSTVQLPLGRWFTVGGTVRSDVVRQGEIATRELRSEHREVLQLRVTAP